MMLLSYIDSNGKVVDSSKIDNNIKIYVSVDLFDKIIFNTKDFVMMIDKDDVYDINLSGVINFKMIAKFIRMFVIFENNAVYLSFKFDLEHGDTFEFSFLYSDVRSLKMENLKYYVDIRNDLLSVENYLLYKIRM